MSDSQILKSPLTWIGVGLTAGFILSTATSLISKSFKKEEIKPKIKKFSALGGGKEWHQIAYSEWKPLNPSGKVYNRVLVCVHGLTRNKHDFDYLAKYFCEHKAPYDFIYCVDVVGRGDSDYLTNKLDYGYPTYNADLAAFIGAVSKDGQEVDYIGTSMGGLIGMFLAATPKCPISRLILNDIGPFCPKEALLPIAAYAGGPPQTFTTFDEALGVLKARFKGFALSDEQWKNISQYSVVKKNDSYTFNYDHNIGIGFSDASKLVDIDLWGLWDNIKCKVWVLRGQQSPLLIAETLKQMSSRGPKLEGTAEFGGVGHAPSLMNNSQLAILTKFLGF